jgi:hypothetical protein
MDYYDKRAAILKRIGADDDFGACLEYNPQSNWDLPDVKRVLAVIEGEYDSSAWHWIVALLDERFVYLTGCCDYTGWD